MEITIDTVVVEDPKSDTQNSKCQNCDLCTKDIDSLKRHQRDTHGTSFDSLSPQQKKLKKNEDDFEVMESLDIIEKTDEKKVIDEIAYWVDARESVKHLDADVEMADECLIASENKNDEKSNQCKTTLKPYLRDLPDAVKTLVGENKYLFPIEGDGACGPRTFAAWIFQEPSLGPYLARNMNSHLVQY